MPSLTTDPEVLEEIGREVHTIYQEALQEVQEKSAKLDAQTYRRAVEATHGSSNEPILPR